jgi:hypothetical protein
LRCVLGIDYVDEDGWIREGGFGKASKRVSMVKYMSWEHWMDGRNCDMTPKH